jgi:hypothetical protein
VITGCSAFAEQDRTEVYRISLSIRILEHENVGAAGGEGLHIGHRRLAFGTAKGFLDRRHVVEMQNCDQVIGSWKGF